MEMKEYEGVRDIVNDGMEQGNRVIEISTGALTITITPYGKENKIDISEITEARREISRALIASNYSDRTGDIREYLLKALGKLDKFLHEHGNEEV